EWAKLHIAERQEYRDLFKGILALNSRLYQLRREVQGGIISAEDYALQTNRLSNEILEIVDALESGKLRREKPSQPKASAPSLLKILTGIITAPVALVTAPVILAAQSVKNIKSALTPARIGKIVYESPSKMRLNQAERVTVRISQKSLQEEVLKKGLNAAKTKEGALEISDVMEVALFEAAGQQNFHIFPLNNAEQVLNKKSYTEWRFILNAKRVGKFSLILRISMKMHLPELGEKKKDIVTWSSFIEVDVDSEVQMGNIPIQNIQWDNTFKKRLKEQITNNDFGSVFQDLANHLSIRDTELFNDLVVLQTRFNHLESVNLMGMLNHQDYSIDYSRIAGSLIRLIDEAGSPRDENGLETYKSQIAGLISN
ncbi:MAG TPA: hypothetical protein PLL53_11635, partial [Saprospiraceae bacterium]|nr:hypothetical protein [Saprospiraceae bacterium]